MEEASQVAVPPVSELVRELVSRPHSATELKKVVFVQLGSKSTVPMSMHIHQFSLEPSPNDEHSNVQECANSIYEKVCDLQKSDNLQRSDDVDAVDGATHRITRTLLSEVMLVEQSPPQTDTPSPSLSLPSYDTESLESRSMPAIGQSCIVEQLRVTESASVGNSPQIEHIMKAHLAVQQELVGEARKLNQTIEDTAEKHGDKVVAAIQGDRRTTTKQLDVISTSVEAVVDEVHSVQVTDSASVGNSLQIEHIMKAQLAAQKELLREIRELRKTIGDRAEKHGDKVVAAIQGDRTTTEQLDVISTNVEAVGDKVHSLQDTVATIDRKVEEVQAEVSTVKERTDKIQDTVEGVDAQLQELDDGLQDLSMLCSV